MQSSLILSGIIILIIIWAFIERKLITTTKYTIASPKLPVTWKPAGIVVLADLHNSTFGKNSERLIKKIDQLKPSYILIAGDMINKKEPCYPCEAYSLLEILAGKYPVYYAYGNHEQKMEWYGNPEYQTEHMDPSSAENMEKPTEELRKKQLELYSTWIEYKNRLSNLGVIFLDNKSLRLSEKDAKVSVTGISLSMTYFEFNKTADIETSYLKELVTPDQKDDFRILIAHNPYYFEKYQDWGADLILSGHYHGGMVRIPGIGGIISPQATFFPRYASGRHVRQDCTMVVSRGLGSHSVMPRLFNIPELIYITIANARDQQISP